MYSHDIQTLSSYIASSYINTSTSIIPDLQHQHTQHHTQHHTTTIIQPPSATHIISYHTTSISLPCVQHATSCACPAQHPAQRNATQRNATQGSTTLLVSLNHCNIHNHAQQYQQYQHVQHHHLTITRSTIISPSHAAPTHASPLQLLSQSNGYSCRGMPTLPPDRVNQGHLVNCIKSIFPNEHIFTYYKNNIYLYCKRICYLI